MNDAISCMMQCYAWFYIMHDAIFSMHDAILCMQSILWIVGGKIGIAPTTDYYKVQLQITITYYDYDYTLWLKNTIKDYNYRLRLQTMIT